MIKTMTVTATAIAPNIAVDADSTIYAEPIKVNELRTVIIASKNVKTHMISLYGDHDLLAFLR